MHCLVNYGINVVHVFFIESLHSVKQQDALVTKNL